MNETQQRRSALLRDLRLDTRGEYDQATEEATLDCMKEAIESIKEKQGQHEQAVRDLVNVLRGDALRMLEDANKLDRKIQAFNRQLSSVPISDLRSVGIRLQHLEGEKMHLERILSMADERELTLFNENSAQALETIKRRLQERPRFLLTDLFSIEFPIETNDGKRQVFTDLSSIESKGTTTAIKVLIYMLLLRQYIQSNRPIAMPFYLDEVDQIDVSNLSRIVSTALDQGFVPILASPAARDVAEDIYFIQNLGHGEGSVIEHTHHLGRRVTAPAAPESNPDVAEKATT
jgi:hypothetical protein